MMPAFTLNPNATGTYSDWTNVGGASALASVSDVVDTNYIENPADGTGRRHSFGLEDLPVDALSVDGAVVLNSRLGRSGPNPGQGQTLFRYGGTDLLGSNFTWGTSWTDRQDSFPSALGGGEWTPAILNATEIGVYHWGSAADKPHTTKLYATGNYTPLFGSVFLILSHVGSLLGSHILLSSMPRIAAAVYRMRQPGIARVLILPREYEAMWRALRAHPFRAYG